MQRIDGALDHVRPHLHVDGGDVQLVDVSDDFVVQIRWIGACKNCDMSPMTLRAGIEQTILASIPEVKKVLPVN